MSLETGHSGRYATWVRKKLGGRCIKLTTAGPFGKTGDPDRLTLLKGPLYIFIEFKSEGKTTSPIQNEVHKHYKRMGFPVYVVYSYREARWITEKHIEINDDYLNQGYLGAEEVSARVHTLWLEETRSGIFSGSGPRKDIYHVASVQDTSKARIRGHTRGVGKTSDRVRRVASRDKEMELAIQIKRRARERKVISFGRRR
jgi:hypothetical protein